MFGSVAGHHWTPPCAVGTGPSVRPGVRRARGNQRDVEQAQVALDLAERFIADTELPEGQDPIEELREGARTKGAQTPEADPLNGRSA